jgi:hypothetical protein
VVSFMVVCCRVGIRLRWGVGYDEVGVTGRYMLDEYGEAENLVQCSLFSRWGFGQDSRRKVQRDAIVTLAMRCSFSMWIARRHIDSPVLVSAWLALVVLCRDRKHDNQHAAWVLRREFSDPCLRLQNLIIATCHTISLGTVFCDMKRVSAGSLRPISRLQHAHL